MYWGIFIIYLRLSALKGGKEILSSIGGRLGWGGGFALELLHKLADFVCSFRL